VTADREPQTERLAITIEEAAERLGIGRSLAYAAAKDGSLPVRRIGRRLVVPLAQLNRMLEGLSDEPNGRSATRSA
jgi:excisionase family DNA binding protein